VLVSLGSCDLDLYLFKIKCDNVIDLCTNVVFYLQMKRKISISEYMVLQGFRIYLKTLGKTTYVLTTHGKFDRVDVCHIYLSGGLDFSLYMKQIL